jgi:uncharacterized protein with von Willebrand factor type A (vWA) domain
MHTVPAFIVALARRLRAAGYAIGPSHVITAVEAAAAVPLRRDDLRAALQASMVDRPELRVPFREMFDALWQASSGTDGNGGEVPRSAFGIGDDELDIPAFGTDDAQLSPEEEELEALLSRLEFSIMDESEMEAVKAAIRRLGLPALTTKTRRFAPHPRGQRIDLRGTLRDQFRSGHGFTLRRKRRRERPVPITVICDISESMTKHSRLLLHFMHMVAQEPGARSRISAFVFGTQLTPVTRYLRERDVELAIENIADAVNDWSRATDIAASLEQFNRLWSRRVLQAGSLLLFITDGVDFDLQQRLGAQFDRLRRTASRMIWLDPIVERCERLEQLPGVQLLKAMSPEILPFRNLDDLASLALALRDKDAARKSAREFVRADGHG